MLETLKLIGHYLFVKAPGNNFNYYTYAFIGIALLIAISFGLRTLYSKKVANKDFIYKKMFRLVPNRIIYFSIGFLFFIAVRYENIPYFAMRIWLILTGLGFAIFAIRQIYKYLKIYPRERDNYDSRPKVTTTSTYLPNKNRR